MKTHVAPIELIHPNGAPRGTAVLGDDIPDWLLPVEVHTDGEADVVLVAADAARAEGDARAAAQRLSGEGIVIAVGRRRARETLAARLADSGIAYGEHLTARRRRSGGGIELGVGGGSPPAVSVLRSETVAATVLRRDELARLGGWLPGTEPRLEVRTSWRGSGDTAVATRSDERGTRALYAKLGLGEATCDVGAQEAAALTTLGGSAAAAGARVPQVLGRTQVAGRPVALLSPLEGRPLAQDRRRTMRAGGNDAVDWLMRFARETRASAPGPPLIEATVLGPAALVVQGFDRGTAYVEELRRLAVADGNGANPPAAAAHGDLTLWNVLDGKPPGILDWVGASERALPLVDLPYLLVDAAYWRSLRRDRVRSFRTCFSDDGVLIDEQALGFAVPAEIRRLSFHACWLGHAANEQARDGDGPFTEIVRTIASRATP